MIGLQDLRLINSCPKRQRVHLLLGNTLDGHFMPSLEPPTQHGDCLYVSNRHEQVSRDVTTFFKSITMFRGTKSNLHNILPHSY
jgi:hypothetical protein